MESNLDTAESKTEDIYKSETYNPIQFKTGLKFHINKNLHFSVDYINSNFEATTPKNPDSKSWSNINDIVFSIGASF